MPNPLAALVAAAPSPDTFREAPRNGPAGWATLTIKETDGT
jgi:hypothetical protein